MAKIDVLLTSLEKVKKTGADRWIARCPAHADKSPSLSIRYIDDKILMHCFGGCAVSDVVSAIGLTLSDLMPDQVGGNGYQNNPRRAKIPASDLLEFIHFEAILVTHVLESFLDNLTISPDDFKRLQLALERLDDAAQECLR